MLNTVCRFKAFGNLGNQGNAHKTDARIHASGLAGEEAARQNNHIIVGDQRPGEFRIGKTELINARPEVEAGVGHCSSEQAGQLWCNRFEFFTIQAAIGDDMRFVVPCGNTRRLHYGTHGTAVVGAIEQEEF